MKIPSLRAVAFLRAEIAGVFAAAKAIRIRLLTTFLAGVALTAAVALLFDERWAAAGDAPFGEPSARFGAFISHWSKPHLIPLGVAVAAWIAGYVAKRKRWRDAALAATLAMLVVGTIFGAAPKGLIGRARPPLGEPWKFVGPNRDSRTQGFPSGHTTHTVAFAGTLLLLAPEIGVPALALPVATGYGRLAIHAHYPSDVAAGATAGLLGAMVAAETVRRRRSRQSPEA